jgi:hypoxanthine phosphoribosyltransferase
LGIDAEEPVPSWLPKPPRPGPPAPPPARPAPNPGVAAPRPAGAGYTFDQILAESGLEAAQLKEVESYGLLAGRAVGRETYYDDDALGVAQLAAQFLQFGVEARHLRMYRTSAEREAGFVESVVMPLVKQRNPRAREQAIETVETSLKLGDSMRATMLRALRTYSSPDSVRALVLLDREALRAVVGRLGREISDAYGGERTTANDVVLVALLRGSVVFLADLVRALTIDCAVDFLAVSSYARGSGRIRLLKDLDIDIAGRDVVLVEDVVDTGLTLAYLLGELRQREPASLEVCTLIDKQSRRRARAAALRRHVGRRPIRARLRLDIRPLPQSRQVAAAPFDEVQADPDMLVADLYPAPECGDGPAARGRVAPWSRWSAGVRVPGQRPDRALRESVGDRLPPDLHRHRWGAAIAYAREHVSASR